MIDKSSLGLNVCVGTCLSHGRMATLFLLDGREDFYYNGSNVYASIYPFT
jgi:hypothetical protein